ncbi:MAG: MSHA biogenesis protein MshP [Paraglaciecola sp.]|jgi:MSHA biogenesis protein MshP
MCHKSRAKNGPGVFISQRLNRGQPRLEQQGSMLIIALFLIIVMALLGLTLSRLLSASSDAIIYEVYGQRALNAANAGSEAQIALTFPVSGVASCSTTIGPTIDFSSVPGLEGCAVSAQCTQFSVVDGGVTLTYYKFSSTGTCKAGDVVATRTLQVDAIL